MEVKGLRMYCADSFVMLWYVLPTVAVPLGLNFAQGFGLVNRRLLDALYENVNNVSGEKLLRVNCTERI
jgi:hypothetical protein